MDIIEPVAGALISPIDLDDRIYEHVAYGCNQCNYYLAPVPDEFDLRTHVKPSRDQGARPTCAAFCAATIREIHERKNGSFDDYMSPEFIYYHRENKPGRGMYGRNVFQILQKIGSVPESSFPYATGDPKHIDKKMYKLASKYRIANYARITTMEGLKRALLEIGPCYLQLPLYAARPYFWRQSVGEMASGGHAVTVVGFTKEGFILKNSWGHMWNGDGCIIFPYDEWHIHLECWVSVG